MQLKTILEERASVVEDMKTVVNLAMSENRSMTSEEQESYDKMNNRVSELTEMKRSAENLKNLQSDIAQDGIEFRTTGAEFESAKKEVEDKEERSAQIFEKYLRKGKEGLMPEEIRQMQTDESSKGQAFVTTTFSDTFVKTRNQFNVMRQLATVYPLGATNHEIAVETGLPIANWTAEGGAISASEPTSRKVTLSPHKLTCMVKVSDELLADSRFPIETMLAEQMGRAMANAEELAMVDGSTSETTKPMGLTRSATNMSACATLGVITRDELMNTFYALPRQYREQATWLLSDDALKVIRKMVTEDGGSAKGNTIWVPGLREGEPDTLLGRPVRTSGSAAVTSVVDGRPGGIYDMSYYNIGDRLGFEVKRLTELYAANGFQAFLATIRVDGDFLVADAGRSILNSSS
jgi:HK97 family phage major capsid protein